MMPELPKIFKKLTEPSDKLHKQMFDWVLIYVHVKMKVPSLIALVAIELYMGTELCAKVPPMFHVTPRTLE